MRRFKMSRATTTKAMMPTIHGHTGVPRSMTAAGVCATGVEGEGPVSGVAAGTGVDERGVADCAAAIAAMSRCRRTSLGLNTGSMLNCSYPAGGLIGSFRSFFLTMLLFQ